MSRIAAFWKCNEPKRSRLRVGATLSSNSSRAHRGTCARRYGALTIPLASTRANSTTPGPIRTEVLVIGAGIAGLTFALSLPFPANVLIATKGVLGESNTRYAQGGLAAALDKADNTELHLADTIRAGAGLVDVDTAKSMVEGAREAVSWLIEKGTEFDKENNALAFGNEGAHSRARVLHAGGDATGAEIERALVAEVSRRADLSILEHTTALEIDVHDGHCAGALLSIGTDDRRVHVSSGLTVLAMGGAGQLWGVTSNPSGATGDGIAIAMRAGAKVADLEFTQFHPTVLDLPGHEPFLISEAARGDGAWLRNDSGDRFMIAVDDRAELAPRDVVARAIQREILDGSKVWLDLRHLDSDYVRRRFPTADRHLSAIGLDLTRDLIPVAPAAHYFMGGVAASPEGHTSIPKLLAIGEVSCTGVHGANRLASNSLLEGLVFGRRSALAVCRNDLMPNSQTSPVQESPEPNDQQHLVAEARQRIRDVMRRHVSVVRSAESLHTAADELDSIAESPAISEDSVASHELRNMLLMAMQITRSAQFRQESRGGHFRSDYPDIDPSLNHKHQLVTRSTSEPYQRRYGSLR